MIDVAIAVVAFMLIVLAVCVTLLASIVTMSFVESFLKGRATDKRSAERIRSDS